MKGIVYYLDKVLSLVKDFEPGINKNVNNRMLLDYKKTRYLITIKRFKSKDDNMYEDIVKYLKENEIQKDCGYCKGGFHTLLNTEYASLGMINIGNKNDLANLYIKSNDDNSLGEFIYINYCPMCGKQFNRKYPKEVYEQARINNKVIK